MSKWSDATKAVALNAVAAVSTHLALFNGDPLDGGTELSSASYARQAISFPTATNGTVLAAESPVFQLRADDSATHLAIMNALTVGLVRQQDPIGAVTIPSDAVGDTPFTVSSVTLRLNNTV